MGQAGGHQAVHGSGVLEQRHLDADGVLDHEQPSIRHRLDQEKAQSKAQHKEKVKVKTKDRGVEL